MIRLIFDASDAFSRLRALERRITNLPFRKIGLYVATSTKRRIKAGITPEGRPFRRISSITEVAKGSSKPLQDTGRLRNSITYKAGRDYVAIGTNLVYGRLHQFGGEVVARNSRFLTIPLRRKAKRYRPHEFPERLFVMRHGRNLYLVSSSGGGRVLKFWYMLKRRVNIPSRPFLGLSADDRAQITAIVLNHLRAR